MYPPPKILLAQDTIDSQDFKSLVEWLQTEPRLTKGEQTIAYEKKYAEAVGCKHAVFVNSGSSANLLMVYALVTAERLKNKKVVVPALSWITDIAPVMQLGLEPILCDCNMDNLAVDLKNLESIFIQHQPALLILVSVLGMSPDMDAINNLCAKYGVILVLDNCESQGSMYNGKEIQSFGVMSSCSSYYGHITSTIEGGMVCTDDFALYTVLKMLRSHGWDRDIDTTIQQQLRVKHNVDKFNSLYTFYVPGFNLRSTDLQAFIGIRQLDKLKGFAEKRNANFNLYRNKLKKNLWKPKEYSTNFVSNLGYPVIHNRRKEIVEELAQQGVEVRPLISGSMGAQPFYVLKYGQLYLPNVAEVDIHGFYLPNHPQITEENIDFICKIINKY